MCFSATASFVTAAVTGAAGIAALGSVSRREEIPLAAVPVIFAMQQSVEGMLWLALGAGHDGAAVDTLVIVFLLFAKVLWPTLVPMATVLVEPDLRRRRLMLVLLAAGAAVGGYFLWSILTFGASARIGLGHIVYGGEPQAPVAVQVAYFAVTCLTALLSSFPAVRWFAGIVIVGSLTSYHVYWEAFSSVWCFFAAAASAVIVFHFRQVRRLPQVAQS